MAVLCKSMFNDDCSVGDISEKVVMSILREGELLLLSLISQTSASNLPLNNSTLSCSWVTRISANNYHSRRPPRSIWPEGWAIAKQGEARMRSERSGRLSLEMVVADLAGVAESSHRLTDRSQSLDGGDPKLSWRTIIPGPICRGNSTSGPTRRGKADGYRRNQRSPEIPIRRTGLRPEAELPIESSWVHEFRT
jgi:hypothetical protein